LDKGSAKLPCHDQAKQGDNKDKKQKQKHRGSIMKIFETILTFFFISPSYRPQ
jgi:hypothetical protein